MDGRQYGFLTVNTKMGWAIRVLLVLLSILLIALLFLSIPADLNPDIESALIFIVATMGVNLIIGLAVLFKFGNKG